jgi:hypothetical protein
MPGPVDFDEGLPEVFQLWSATTADELQRILVLHQPIRATADAHEPLALLEKHHETEPATSFVTALLLLTDRRWRKGVSQFVRRIADSGILDAEQLELLARTFLVADDALYWKVPDEWFDGPAIVIELDQTWSDDDPGDDPDEEIDDVEEDDGPVVVRRDVVPPLRRWAAAHLVSENPEGWPALLARAKELDARSGSAILAGVLDRRDVLPPATQRLLVDEGLTSSNKAVRRLALGFIAEHDGADAAHRLARDDTNAQIRAWGESLLTPSSAPNASEPPRDAARGADVDDPPTLF